MQYAFNVCWEKDDSAPENISSNLYSEEILAQEFCITFIIRDNIFGMYFLLP